MALHKQNQPPLKSLIAFEAVARHSSFTLAAQELNLSQSAISRQIKRLEEILSRPLFLRKPHHVELTPAGKSYLEVIQKLFHELDKATTELQRRGHKDQLTFATTHSISTTWLSYRIKEFRQLYPHINIRVLCNEHAKLLDINEYDLAFFYHLDHNELVTGLEFFPLFERETVICVCSPEYLKQYGSPESTQQLLQRTLLMVEDHYHDWLTWNDWFNYHGIKKPVLNEMLRSDCYQLVIKMASMDMGIALGWERVLKDDLDKGNLCLALPQTMPSAGHLTMMLPQNRYPTDATRVFKKWLLQSIIT